MEVIVGAKIKKDLHTTNKKLLIFNSVDIDQSIMRLARDLIEKYALSHGMTIYDSIITATCLTYDLPLWTHNKKDFKYIKDLKLEKNLKVKILILSASNKVWLINAFKQALLRNGGGQVIAADIAKHKIALYFANQYRIIPGSNAKEYISEIITLCQQQNIQLIVPTRDGELKILSQNIKLFEKNNIKVMVAKPDTIEICQDKYKFYQYCTKHQLKVVKTALQNDISEVEFPAFIKPRKGSGSQLCFIATTPEKLEQFLNLYDEIEFVIQPLIKEQEYTVDLFSDFNSNVISVIPRQRIEVQHGESSIGVTENNPIIIEQATKLAKSLRLIGHNTIQCFYNKNTELVLFIEVNPRYGGGAFLGFSAGISTANYLIQLMNGETIKSTQDDLIQDLWMFKYTHNVALVKNENNYYENIGNDKVFCIDIDGTICTEFCHYEDAKPIQSVINKINHLYNNGHKIILFTSRGYSSGYNWIPLIKKQLKKWGVLYHELKQGKPFADYYIDNKAINVMDWL